MERRKSSAAELSASLSLMIARGVRAQTSMYSSNF